jgi:hypothetical protein
VMLDHKGIFIQILHSSLCFKFHSPQGPVGDVGPIGLTGIQGVKGDKVILFYDYLSIKINF